MKKRSLAAVAVLALLLAGRAWGAEPAGPAAVAKLAKQAGAPREAVLRLALRAQGCALERGVGRPDLLALIDYSLPSTEPRFWVLDLRSGRLLYHELVAHGRGSGENLARSFGNAPGSRMSSLGLFLTDDVYQGEHGTSLRLRGLEPGINDAARNRALVIHGAPYVSAAYAREHARLGRSWGCPALAEGVCQQVIETLGRGTLLWAYYPDRRWLESSPYLRCDG